MSDPRDVIETWRQGEFIDSRRYSHMSDEWKRDMQSQELLLVRPSGIGNPICQVFRPEDARWIAERLNLAARFEREKLS